MPISDVYKRFPFQNPTDDVDEMPDTTPNKTGTLLPDVLQGNYKNIPAGRNATLIQWEAPDGRAQMVTLAVYPSGTNPQELFDPAGFSLMPSSQKRYSGLHRVQIDFGVGAKGSQSFFVDLKRGFKVSLPASSVKATVFNVFDAANAAVVAAPADYALDIGASLVRGDSSNNDSLTITVASGLLEGDEYFATIIPPFAKSVDVFVCNNLGDPSPASQLLFGSIHGGGIDPLDRIELSETFVGGQAMPQSYPLPGNINGIEVEIREAPGSAIYTVVFVFRLGM